MLAVIGSTALRKQGLNVAPRDIDLVGDYDELVSFFKAGAIGFAPSDLGAKLVGRGPTPYEAEICWPGSTSDDLLRIILADPGTVYGELNGHTVAFASLDVCYTLKMSHRFRKSSPHFLKTMRDIHVLRALGATICDDAFFKRREKETLAYKHPNLSQSKASFFSDDVPYEYDHDSIHEAVKLFDRPAYSYFKPDHSEVQVSKAMFFDLEEPIKLAAVYEEACVLALERSQVPFPSMEPRRSFLIALEKVCTSITSGWFRAYAWENYDAVLAMYVARQDYVERFRRGLTTGVVRPVTPN